MTPLIVAIVVLSVSILISRQSILMRDWYIWACMLTETYMRGELESRKLEVLQKAGCNRFPITLKIMSKGMFRRLIHNVKSGLMDYDHTMKDYNRLVQGIALYDKDYKYLLSLIDDVGKREKA